MSYIGSSIRFQHKSRLAAALPQLLMASFGGVELGTMGAGVFELTSESDDEEFVHTLGDGTVVIIPANCRNVVARECPGVDFETTHTHSREAANLALDVYFGHGGRPLLMAHKDSPYAVVWKASGGFMLRLVGRNLMTSRLRAKVLFMMPTETSSNKCRHCQKPGTRAFATTGFPRPRTTSMTPSAIFTWLLRLCSVTLFRRSRHQMEKLRGTASG